MTLQLKHETDQNMTRTETSPNHLGQKKWYIFQLPTFNMLTNLLNKVLLDTFSFFIESQTLYIIL